MPTVRLIDPSVVPGTHQAFQEYVKRWGKTINIFGKETIVVVTRLSSTTGDKSWAPAHSVELDCFGRAYGLPELQMYIDQLEKQGKVIDIFAPDSWDHVSYG